MPRITLSDAVDVMCKAGTPKQTKVSQIKNRPPYHPSIDFYKALRDELTAVHSNGAGRDALKSILAKVSDPKKIKNYDKAVSGYSKWWGRKSVGWFEPPRAIYSANGVTVNVNPELGLEFEGRRHLIKLYLKDEKLQRLRIDPVTAMMELALRPLAKPDDLVGILDVRNAKLHLLGVDVKRTQFMVDAELGYIAALWPNV